MKKTIVYDIKGNKKGTLKRLDDIKDKWQYNTLEAFVRLGCVLFETSQGRYGALPGRFAKIVEVKE